MKGLFGVTNLSPIVFSNCIKERWPDKKFQVLGFKDTVKPRADIILIPSVDLFSRNKSILEKTRAHVFVFDTAVRLEYLVPIKLLDAKKIEDFQYKIYNLMPEDIEQALRENKKIEVVGKNLNIIPKLLNSTIPSIMKDVLTFLYTINDSEKRSLYKEQIFTYFSDPKLKLGDLRASLVSISGQKKSSKSLDKILNYLDQDLAKNVKKAVVSALSSEKKTKSENIEKLCTSLKVSSFDVRYLIKAVSKDKNFHIKIKD